MTIECKQCKATINWKIQDAWHQAPQQFGFARVYIDAAW